MKHTAIADKNNYENCNANNLDQMCGDLQWILHIILKMLLTIKGGKFCCKSIDSVCVNQTEKNSVSNFNVIAPGELALKNNKKKTQLQQHNIFVTWIKMHLYFLFIIVTLTHIIIVKTKKLKLHRYRLSLFGIFISINVFDDCSLIDDVKFEIKLLVCVGTDYLNQTMNMNYKIR